MKHFGRAYFKGLEQLEADAEKRADQIFGFIIGVLCVSGFCLFFWAFASVIFAFFCE